MSTKRVARVAVLCALDEIFNFGAMRIQLAEVGRRRKSDNPQ